MPYMSTNEIRERFLKFFEQNSHREIDSSSLIPGNDPTLLFTNAGMVQFKDVFLGTDKRNYNRAASSQRCVRAGGKHNDLDNVGYTARHHTFFEMLGNFSFGDYFKKEAIRFAWEFLTVELKLPEDRLWITVYNDDDEAADIWFNDIGVNKKRFSRMGEKDNFWSMGDTGPCGPCSEIFFDHGSDVAGGPPGSPDEDGDRYIEIWNLVFMQFDRASDGKMTPLPNPSIDTGMGLERIAAIMQGVHSNYEIDLFRQLIEALEKQNNLKDVPQASLNVVADHIRACAFLIADGVVPSNEGRGYVLRRIIRRAIRHGHKLGIENTFFYKMVQPLIAQMGNAFPILTEQQANIEKLLIREEEQFLRTLDNGMRIFESEVANISNELIPGELIFKLYDTYGFPTDLTADIARERNLQMDMPGFDECMAVQKQNARAASKFGIDSDTDLGLDGNTRFEGYQENKSSAEVIHLIKDNQAVTELNEGDTGALVLSNTPFYAESGGQVGDTGIIKTADMSFKVTDTQKNHDHFVHYGKVELGNLAVGMQVESEIDERRRTEIRANHSATHLMHAALRQVLGEHVQQKGSLVNERYLRFDFSHLEPVTTEELVEIERIVNDHIRANHAVNTDLMTPEAAQEAGAMALFGEKYGDVVRVLTMGKFSMELCGGTHVAATGDIGLFRITTETGIAAGVRRIEAVTADHAIAYTLEQQQIINDLSGLVKTDATHLVTKIEQLQGKNRQLERQIEKLNSRIASGSGNDIEDQIQTAGNYKFLVTRIDDIEPKALRESMDKFKNKLQSGVVIMASVRGDKISLIAGVSQDLVSSIKAGDVVNHLAEQVGGRGGGRPDMAQAGGHDVENLDSAINNTQKWLAEQLSNI
ncbi:MAG: alanine--tRNA ligase [Enterobacterales bacterium]|nr:alanine--tRNA ligase [Enterobacterales bacterium]